MQAGIQIPVAPGRKRCANHRCRQAIRGVPSGGGLSADLGRVRKALMNAAAGGILAGLSCLDLQAVDANQAG
jgi:hypothetical protein